jgi:ornithine decarboxylase
MGIDPERILYANPCKRPDDICFAKNNKVLRTTFDSVCELKKIAKEMPSGELILRIRADDPSARCNLGVKYGAQEHEWDILLFTAKMLGLEVIGVSFHVGSFASSPYVFSGAIEKALKAVDLARDHGFSPRIIDIGGGFSSVHSLPRDLTVPEGIELFAEPGRFFAERTMTLYTPVIGVKGSGLTISESLYGAFNCRIFDHAEPVPVFQDLRPKSPKTLFGCTCDGIDVIYDHILLPEFKIGDWIEWPNMGAYTMAATTSFNGIPFQKRPTFLKQ